MSNETPPEVTPETDPALEAVVQRENELLNAATQEAMRESQLQHLFRRCINLSLQLEQAHEEIDNLRSELANLDQKSS